MQKVPDFHISVTTQLQRDMAHTFRIIGVKSSFPVPILPKFTFLLLNKVICQTQFKRKSFIIAQSLSFIQVLF